MAVMKKMRSRFESPCIGPGVGHVHACKGRIYIGEEIVYMPKRGTRCAKCHDVAMAHVVIINATTGEITVTKKETAAS